MKLLTGVLAAALALPLHAAPAVYRDDVLTLPQVLVQRTQGPALYEDVELVRQSSGDFVLAGYNVAPLVEVQSITVEQDQYPPGTVVVIAGLMKSMPCASVAPAVARRVGNTFHFAFEELPPPENVRCIAQLTPDTREFGLQTGELEPGEYSIVYGELHVAFTLHPAP